jgi:alpha-N-arabinofuranosidase
MTWCRKAKLEPMFGVNLGTRGADEARTSSNTATMMAAAPVRILRKASHGFEQPHDIKFWCLGNEMDGPWQICHKTAEEYGRSPRRPPR